MFVYIFRNPLYEGLNQRRVITCNFPLDDVYIKLLKAEGWILTTTV